MNYKRKQYAFRQVPAHFSRSAGGRCKLRGSGTISQAPIPRPMGPFQWFNSCKLLCPKKLWAIRDKLQGEKSGSPDFSGCWWEYHLGLWKGCSLSNAMLSPAWSPFRREGTPDPDFEGRKMAKKSSRRRVDFYRARKPPRAWSGRGPRLRKRTRHHLGRSLFAQKAPWSMWERCWGPR